MTLLFDSIVIIFTRYVKQYYNCLEEMILKPYILIFFFFFAIVYSINSAGDKRTPIKQEQTFMPFNVVYYEGDEGVIKYEINIYKKEGKFYADNISPFIYCNKETDGVWTAELDSNKIAICKDFINTIKSPFTSCVDTYSGTYKVIIKSSTDTSKIIKDYPCPYKDDFHPFRGALFKEKFEEDRLKREHIELSLRYKLAGKWYLDTNQKALQQNDYLTLKRYDESNSVCYWKFGIDSSFKSHCNQSIDLMYSKEYSLNIWDENFLNIEAEIDEKENGEYSILTEKAVFRIDSLDENILKLQLLRRY